MLNKRKSEREWLGFGQNRFGPDFCIKVSAFIYSQLWEYISFLLDLAFRIFWNLKTLKGCAKMIWISIIQSSLLLSLFRSFGS